MKRRARLADGSGVGRILCDVASIDRSIEEFQVAIGAWSVTPARRRLDAWPTLRVGLLRDIAGLSGSDVSRRLTCAASTASLLYRRHLALLEEDAVYGERASLAVTRAWRQSGLADSARFLSKWS